VTKHVTQKSHVPVFAAAVPGSWRLGVVLTQAEAGAGAGEGEGDGARFWRGPLMSSRRQKAARFAQGFFRDEYKSKGAVSLGRGKRISWDDLTSPMRGLVFTLYTLHKRVMSGEEQ
jgi:hypothetical protein